MTAALTTRILAGVIGVAGAMAHLLPPVIAVEEQVGLAALFSIRGVKSPPESTEIIAISDQSALAYGLPTSLREWPRALHAELVDALSDAGAAAIVFDIAFEEERPAAGDAQLADAARRSGRVILLERVRARQVELAGLGSPARRLSQVPAVEAIGAEALGRGPFTLPTVPIRTSQFWVFGGSAANGPTLPALAAQVALVDAYPRLIGFLSAHTTVPLEVPIDGESLLAERRLEDAMRTIRGMFVDDPSLAGKVRNGLAGEPLGAAERARAEALVDLYAGAASRYLNFYGPSGTVPTRAFHDVVRPEGGPSATAGLEGKVVFVGFSEREQIAQQDEFVSVYSEISGLSLSGVEIGATASANLVSSGTVEPLARPLEVAWLAVWGAGLALLVSRRRLWLGYAAATALGGAYIGVAAGLFARFGLWVPLVVPLGLQLPGALLGMTLVRYRSVVAQRELLRSALGPYSAPAVIEKLARETVRHAQPSRVVYGTCLFTDVAGYTGLAESLEPSQLAALMNEYFAEIGRVVAAAGGTVADIAGDSLVGLWVSAEPTPATSRRALAAALDVGTAISRFNAAHAPVALTTPIGLEAGAVALTPRPANGALRPVGDMVNTAARIQSLNRHLGTQALTSVAVRSAADVWRGRRVGRFLLFGKQQPIDVWELRSRSEPPADEAEFAEAVKLFERGDFGGARARFAAIGAADGVCAFYIKLCARLQTAGAPAGWDGTIVMAGK